MRVRCLASKPFCLQVGGTFPYYVPSTRVLVKNTNTGGEGESGKESGERSARDALREVAGEEYQRRWGR